MVIVPPLSWKGWGLFYDVLNSIVSGLRIFFVFIFVEFLFIMMLLIQIWKDKDEVEVWLGVSKALIIRACLKRWKTELGYDGIPSEANSPGTQMQRSSPLHSPLSNSANFLKVLYSS